MIVTAVERFSSVSDGEGDEGADGMFVGGLEAINMRRLAIDGRKVLTASLREGQVFSLLCRLWAC